MIVVHSVIIYPLSDEVFSLYGYECLKGILFVRHQAQFFYSKCKSSKCVSECLATTILEKKKNQVTKDPFHRYHDTKRLRNSKFSSSYSRSGQKGMNCVCMWWLALGSPLLYSAPLCFVPLDYLAVFLS